VVKQTGSDTYLKTKEQKIDFLVYNIGVADSFLGTYFSSIFANKVCDPRQTSDIGQTGR